MGTARTPRTGRTKHVNKPKGEVEYDKEVWDADISAQEVINAIHAMKNGKSAGNDSIPVEVYKAIVRDCPKGGWWCGAVPIAWWTR